ncbi:MAG TPA: MFS transporter, partial [Candidatus Limnocylindrales bacterium]
MDRRSALVLLIVFGTGVFLAGLELMITAVALPSILGDLVIATGASAWVELRKASWIINGYLLVYILVMPLAGRLADLWGARRLFIAALAVFIVGSALAGAAQDLDQLIAARLVQAVGGGVLVPVGTAAAAHLYGGAARPRALGVIGALTFLGMAAGPFVGAAILAAFHPEDALVAAGVASPTLAELLAPAWRWVFYFNIPIGLCAIVLAWAASAGWETPRHPGRLNLAGALLFGIALATGLIALTLIGSGEIAGTDLDPTTVTVALGVVAVVATLLAIARALRVQDPFLEMRLFRSTPFSSAALVSLLTGYAFATAIIGGAVFVDRVLYGGPDQQRFALGALAASTALGALLSGFLVRVASYRLVTLIGIALSVGGLVAMASWTADTSIETVALGLAVFGAGFGMTVTPRSTAAVEAAGRRAFGAASSVVTVARMIGMAVGLAILTAYGSTTIDRLAAEVYA